MFSEFLVETTTIYVKPQIKDVGVNTCYSCKSEDTYETDLVRQTMWNVLIQAFVINNSTTENSKYRLTFQGYITNHHTTAAGEKARG